MFQFNVSMFLVQFDERLLIRDLWMVYNRWRVSSKFIENHVFLLYQLDEMKVIWIVFYLKSTGFCVTQGSNQMLYIQYNTIEEPNQYRRPAIHSFSINSQLISSLLVLH